ncbi:MAG: homocysteine S-methyltransferase family protein [Kiritimatiellae bacterium]|nr:homocysteine S-methyltransferase family protein [Kiritimatiellia bacterium]
MTRPDDIIYVNTFGANRAKYHGEYKLDDVITSAISIAKSAAKSIGGNRLVALDVGPSGRLLKPSGDFEFDAAYDTFAE